MVAILGGGLVVMAVVMVLLWFVQRRTANAGIVDVGWSLGVGVVAVACTVAGSGDPMRRLLAGVLVGGWSLRLGLYILRRVLAEEEDGRYRRLRQQWGAGFQRRAFVFFQLQALFAVAFAVPVAVVASNARPVSAAEAMVAVGLWLVAIGGEALADRQLAAFRGQPANRGRTCRQGLWRYSRHPNYFFEWLHWWTYVLLAAGAPLWWLSLLGPLAMLVFLLAVTGVPATEAQAAASRPDYRDYQRTTSAFIPWPPKR